MHILPVYISFKFEKFSPTKMQIYKISAYAPVLISTATGLKMSYGFHLITYKTNVLRNRIYLYVMNNLLLIYDCIVIYKYFILF